MTRGPSRAQRGIAAEASAARFLLQQGLELVAQRYRCRVGELDLVCRDGRYLVVIEVRYRGAGSLARAADTLDARKRGRIVQATRHFLLQHPRWQEHPLRFDVIAIDREPSGRHALHWLRNAFESG